MSQQMQERAKTCGRKGLGGRALNRAESKPGEAEPSSPKWNLSIESVLHMMKYAVGDEPSVC
jgi:hypothetical protein